MGCVVDQEKEGFDCFDTVSGKNKFLHWEEGKGLECSSPDDLEHLLKNCAAKMDYRISSCVIDLENRNFKCIDPSGKPFIVKFYDADTYFCLSPLDRGRILERCNKN